MTYTRGDNRKLITREARENGWTIQAGMWTEVYERRESNIVVTWTPQDTMRYASINMQDSAGRIPARPRMAMVQVREWLSAPGEKTES